MSILKPKRINLLVIIILLFSISPSLFAAIPGIPAVTMSPQANGNQEYSLSLQALAVMTGLAFLPAFLLMMTSFTRIIIVMGLTRQALGLPMVPSNQILVGLALFLTFFIMAPIFEKINKDAIQPYMNEKITFTEAITKGQLPLRDFMLHQTRSDDLEMYKQLSHNDKIDNIDELPFMVLVPAFITSELKTAFQIGFFIFLPFLIIDIVVASVLMSMGMMMLSPMMISLPFKIMLFVLVDGWTLIIGTIAASFGL